MRVVVCFAMLTASISSGALLAQSPPPTASAPATAATPDHYNTTDTNVGILLDDAAARAIVDKYIAGFSSGEQVDMARGMTLRSLQPFAPDRITDQALAEIDKELAKLAAKK